MEKSVRHPCHGASLVLHRLRRFLMSKGTIEFSIFKQY